VHHGRDADRADGLERDAVAALDVGDEIGVRGLQAARTSSIG
jgi:hypothetical protein